MKNTAEQVQNLQQIVVEKDIEITQKDTRIAELEALVKYYEEQYRLHKHRQYGPKSEKSVYDEGYTQPDIFNEAEATVDAAADDGTAAPDEPELREVQRHFRKRKRLVNDSLAENLPIEIVEYKLSESEQECPACGEGLHIMGRGEKRRELVIIPAQVKIVEHVSMTYACRNCEKTDTSVPIIKAALPKPMIKGSYASPEAIAHIMCQKFVMGAPLYRQEQDWGRQGVLLSRQTMSNWLIMATEDYLAPVYEEMRAKLLRHQVLHSDETSLQVLKEPGKPAQSKSSMWLYRTGSDAPEHIVLYEYQPDKSSKRPQAFLKDFKGYLHADGAAYYHALPPEITVVGCFAHARRKFDEALKSVPLKNRANTAAAQGKQYCDRLFELEREFAILSPEERHEKRQKFSKPLLDELFIWAQGYNQLTQTLLGKAVHYLLGQRVYLENFLLDGRLEISNNRAERSIKPFVIGRKNFLFANTPRGARASAILYSIIETVKENGVNPFLHLVHIFKGGLK